MAERMEQRAFVYTHTYDQFTVFFYGDHVYIDGLEFPIGQSVVDVANLDESVLEEIDQRMERFLSAAQVMLREKTTEAAAHAQGLMNEVWDVVFSLPVYRDLPMDAASNYHTFERMMENRELWRAIQTEDTPERERFQMGLVTMSLFAAQLRNFRQQIRMMTQRYFEPLKRRNANAYATAYSYFYADMVRVGAQLGEGFDQSFPLEVSFVPMMHPTEEGKVFVAEKATFGSLVDFLRTEFYQGLAIGNAPRRCHNCGKYFLLTAGYNTCYCNNVAPGETERTCRKVGAHRKEAQGRANRSPARGEYDKAYLRLKQRKLRGKISVDEWNAAVAKAQKLLEQSERGELTDEELRQQMYEL